MLVFLFYTQGLYSSETRGISQGTARDKWGQGKNPNLWGVSPVYTLSSPKKFPNVLSDAKAPTDFHLLLLWASWRPKRKSTAMDHLLWCVLNTYDKPRLSMMHGMKIRATSNFIPDQRLLQSHQGSVDGHRDHRQVEVVKHDRDLVVQTPPGVKVQAKGTTADHRCSGHISQPGRQVSELIWAWLVGHTVTQVAPPNSLIILLNPAICGPTERTCPTIGKWRMKATEQLWVSVLLLLQVNLNLRGSKDDHIFPRLLSWLQISWTLSPLSPPPKGRTLLLKCWADFVRLWIVWHL